MMRLPGAYKPRWFFHHLLIAWLLFIVSVLAVLALVCVLPFILATNLSPEFSLFMETPPEGNGILVMLGVLSVCIVASLFIATRLFSYLWFSYLKLLSNDLRIKVEQKLPQVMRVHAFEPHYSDMRHRFFGDDR